MKSSLVILYHREPYDEVKENGKIYYRDKKSPNGIIPTLKSFFVESEQSTWIAWKQLDSSHEEAQFQERMTIEGSDDTSVVRRIPLTPEQVKNFYYITSKEAFWPILHSFPWQFTYDSSDWDNFQDINQRFATAACEDAAEDALIWIHDYNLWLTPYYIRQQMPHVNIAFFHHTPFPGTDVFNILPWREAIVDSLLCCDLCGFHIPRYVENFVSVAKGLRGVEVTRRVAVDSAFTATGTALAEPEMTTQIRYQDRVVNLDAFPVGTSPAYIRSLVEKPETQTRVQEIRAELGVSKLIVSAGRVDYVKGTKEMLACYERLLERRSDLHGQLKLIVAAAKPAPGMRIYEEAQSEIEQSVGKINSRFAQLNWSPILMLMQPLPYEELIAVFRAADIAWIPPLRDGLNLVAKEYVVAHGGKDGVLILSEFAGSAVELPDAVLTNPYSSHRMDEALEQALEMPLDEQQQRMQKLYQAICRYDVQQWANHMFREAKAKVILEQEPAS